MARAESLKRKRRARYQRKQGSHPTRQKVYMGLCLVQRRQTAQGQLLNMKSSFRRKLWLSNQKAGSFAPFAPSVKMFGWISMTHQRIEGLGHPGDHYGDYGQEDIIGSMLGKNHRFLWKIWKSALGVQPIMDLRPKPFKYTRNRWCNLYHKSGVGFYHKSCQPN